MQLVKQLGELPKVKPNRTYTKGRRCAKQGCNTRLSRYNGLKWCWVHRNARS
jgi:hypothetical protein